MGYVAPEPGDTPPFRLGEGKGLDSLEAQAFANWVMWGKPCPICNGSGEAYREPAVGSKAEGPPSTGSFELLPDGPGGATRCRVCGDTRVVSRAELPLSAPAPGFIDTMGLCPFCGGDPPAST
ncbi:MAG TPA: hypothetical protein VGB87_18650 [Vicinamibacteria bacterium]